MSLEPQPKQAPGRARTEQLLGLVDEAASCLDSIRSSIDPAREGGTSVGELLARLRDAVEPVGPLGPDGQAGEASPLSERRASAD